jgi:hypothetical protein
VYHGVSLAGCRTDVNVWKSLCYLSDVSFSLEAIDDIKFFRFRIGINSSVIEP